MGKNSLIKSTSKKKKKVETTKSTTTQKTNPEPETPPPSRAKVAASEKSAENAPNSKKKDHPKSSTVEKPGSEKSTPALESTSSEPKSPAVTITYDVPSEPATGDPMDKTLLITAGCILFLFILVIGASVSNTSRYYIKKKPMGIEIWQGKFAPLGEKKLIDLPDITAPEIEKAVFNRNDVYPLIFSHYLNKADALLTHPGIPDYESIKTHLIQAQNYAVTNELADAVSKRLVAIDFNNLLYRVNIASSRQSVEELEKALDYLAEASRLKLDTHQLNQVTRQREIIEEMLSELRKSEVAND
jgi:hypothetical protein